MEVDVDASRGIPPTRRWRARRHRRHRRVHGGLPPTQEQRKKKANDLKNSSCARGVPRCLHAVDAHRLQEEAIRTVSSEYDAPRRSAKQKEKDDVRKLLDKKPKRAKKKKALVTAPLGALKTTDKKSELAPIKAASPVAKEPTRTGDHLGEVRKEPTRTGGDDADRPPSRTVWKSNARWRGFTLMPTQVAHAQQARGGRLRF